MASARANNFQTVNSQTAATIYTADDSSKALAFRLQCHDHDSSNAAISTPSPVLVSVQPIHADTEFVPVMPGDRLEWGRSGDPINGIKQVQVKTPAVTGAVATISWDVSIGLAG